MIIREARINNNKKSIEVKTNKGEFSLPFSKLDIVPTPENRVKEIYVDKELGNSAITYVLESGHEDSVHLDEFLDYNKDPEYINEITLYKLTLQAIDLVEKSGLSKRELTRRLQTSASQLYRLLDTANYSKTVDQMLKLLAALGCEVDFTLRKPHRAAFGDLHVRFPHLSQNEIKELPRTSKFKPLMGEHKQAA